jgi:hypothetical protein
MFKILSDDIAGTRNQRRDWHDVVTLDDPWFDYITDHELIWIPPDGKVRNREGVRVSVQRDMRAIDWSSTLLAIVTAHKGRVILLKAHASNLSFGATASKE